MQARTHLLHALPLLFLPFALSTAWAHPPSADFVIVGGGTAGCALAARLCTLNPQKKVLVLERGTPRNSSEELSVRAPRLIVDALFNPSIAETILTVPQKDVLGSPRLPVWAGHTLGGSSAINGMQWLLPLAGTLDRWGIHGLTTTSARPYFVRALHAVGFAKPPAVFQNVHVGKLLAAARRIGYGPDRGALDMGGARSMYPNRIAATTRDGRRVDACTAYLRIAGKRCRNNLRVMQGATVTRVAFDGRRATGVHVAATRHRSRRIFVRARHEVVLSAGPFHSPRLLQLSGIGPKEWLRAAGVPQRVELPVGTRTYARGTTGVRVGYTGARDAMNNLTLVYSAGEREKFARGEPSVLGKAVSVVNGRDDERGYFSSLAIELANQSRSVLELDCFNNPSERSSGFVRLADANPFSPPRVDIALLRDRVDMQRVKTCAEGFVRVMRNLPKSLGATLESPADGQVTEKWIRGATTWGYHMVGGCAAGEVVDGHMRVKKVTGQVPSSRFVKQKWYYLS